MKLTPKQNAVIYCLQNGWQLITDNDFKGALVWEDKSPRHFHINNGLFWRLNEMGLIYQGTQKERFRFVLSEEGKRVKTKPVEIQITLKD